MIEVSARARKSRARLWSVKITDSSRFVVV